MTIIKNLVAIAAIFFGVTALYAGLTVPAFVAQSYLLIAMFCAGVTGLCAWSLSNQNKIWLAVFGVFWTVLMFVGNGAV